MKLISTLFFACLTIVSMAQISHGGKPLTRTNNALSNSIPIITTSTIDKTPLEQEDLITDNIKEIPWRFGVEIPLNLSLTNSGTWETLSNGDRVWRLTIIVPGALSTTNLSKFNRRYSAYADDHAKDIDYNFVFGVDQDQALA